MDGRRDGSGEGHFLSDLIRGSIILTLSLIHI